MLTLLKKEFSLCLHPAAVLFVLFGAFVFIPNYPYEVMFFFSGLGVFFICLTARENGDLEFGCTLPVAKKNLPSARIFMCVILQLAQITVAACCTVLKESLFPMPNLAGMDANVTLLGFGWILLGVFNLCFFPLYFKNPKKVGKPFIFASAAVFLLIGGSVCCCVLSSFFQSKLDTPDPAFLWVKFTVFAFGFVFYAGMTALALWLSRKAFASVDL